MSQELPSPLSATARRSALELGLVAGFLLMAIGSYSVDQAVQGGALGKAIILGRMAIALLIATWLLRRSGQTWRHMGLTRPRRWWMAPLGAIVGLLLAVLAVGAVQGVLLPALDLDRPEISAFSGIKGDFAEYLFWALPVAWGSAAFGEEMIFRGFAQNRLQTLLGGSDPAVWAAVLLQAALFGGLHLYQGLAGALVSATIGLVLGLAWLFTGRNLWAPILVHGLVDFTSMTALYLGAPVAQG